MVDIDIENEIKKITDNNLKYCLNELNVSDDDFKNNPNFGIKLNKILLPPHTTKIEYYLSKDLIDDSLNDKDNILLMVVELFDNNEILKYKLKNKIILKGIYIELNTTTGEKKKKKIEI